MELILPLETNELNKWGNESPARKPSEHFLDTIDEAFSKSKMEESRTLFLRAVDVVKKADDQAERRKLEFASERNFEDRFLWQKRDREESQDRVIQKILVDSRLEAISHIIKGMNALDKVENPKVKTLPAYTELQSGLYREYVKHQFYFKNYTQAVEMLERYIQLGENNTKEAEPHKLLSICYEKLEVAANKLKKVQMANLFKESKKDHLIKYADIQYGKGTPEYDMILEKVMKDY